MKKYLLFTVLILQILLLIGGSYKFYSFYQTEKADIHAKIEETFSSAVVEEVFKRIEDSKMRVIRFDDPNKEKSPKITLTSAEGTIAVDRTPEYEALTLREKETIPMQTMLRRKSYLVNLEDINEIWNSLLEPKNIVIETGVKYRHRDEGATQYSAKDSLFFVTSSRVKEYYTGILNEFTFQGHYKTSFSSIFNYNPVMFVLYGLI
ncbi:MAG: hypothetical protein LUG98_10290, partial [Tannerellaceae bacterium]|nr:hypothetical protein [Tannerellaceae bacterium]